MTTALIPIEFKNQRVLTTQQLAEMYEATADKIKQNFNNNENRYKESKHYFLLQGGELQGFKNKVENFDLVDKRTPKLYLWTEKGCFLHAKSLNTDKAWEVYDHLVESYFKVQEIKESFENLSPILQFMIKSELEQKRIQEKQELLELQQKQQGEKLDNIKEIVALSPTQWRYDTGKLINKMAAECGGNEHIKPIREEAYKLLEERFGVKLGVRLTNKKRLLLENGVCKSKIDKVNKVDVIADDKKLIEGFISIVKELCIKYGVAV